ncbi:MAG: hypothetical protein WA919_17040 [Coleofasciculaceae cyanobacterium]
MTSLEASEKTLKPEATPKNNKPFKLSLQQKNWILSFHIGFAALWTGTVLSMFLIALRNKDTTNSDILFALNSAINLLDDVVVIPAAIGSVITATLKRKDNKFADFPHSVSLVLSLNVETKNIVAVALT